MKQAIVLVLLVIVAVAFFKHCNGFSGGNGEGPFNAKSTNKQQVCSHQEVCSVIQKRYWLPNKVERVCQCAASTNYFCANVYAQDDYSMDVSARIQMRFCEPIRTIMSACRPNEIGATVSNNWTDGTQSGAMGPSHINVKCFCEGRINYWHFYTNTTRISAETDNEYNLMLTVQGFVCVPMRTCEHNDFCGFARTDSGLIYQRCTCPPDTSCIVQDNGDNQIEVVPKVRELFYNGPAYRAYCK